MGCGAIGSNVGRDNHIKLAHLELGRVIGEGGFSKVRVVALRSGASRTRQTRRKHYALKEICKLRLIDAHKKLIGTNRPSPIESIFRERDILAFIRHPFVETLKASFTTEDRLFLLLEFADGGDLRYQLKRNCGCFSLAQARFFVVSVAIALQYIHSKRIIHHDLKPSNLLMNARGYVKLSDFGLAVRIGRSKPSFSTAGTKGYLAPEILSRSDAGHGVKVDFFSLGVMLTEFLGERYDYDSNSLNARTSWPSEVHECAMGLLQHDPSRRMGDDSIFTDEWIVGGDGGPSVEEIEAQRADAPLKPSTTTNNFEITRTDLDQHFGSSAAWSSRRSLDVIEAKDQALFEGFEFDRGDPKTHITRSDVGLFARISSILHLQGKDSAWLSSTVDELHEKAGVCSPGENTEERTMSSRRLSSDLTLLNLRQEYSLAARAPAGTKVPGIRGAESVDSCSSFKVREGKRRMTSDITDLAAAVKSKRSLLANSPNVVSSQS